MHTSHCKVEIPLCSTCIRAKQVRKNEGTVRQEIRKDKDGNLKKDNLRPGAMISSDQYVSKLGGRLYTTAGKENPKDKYMGGTIFVDHASQFIFVENQVSLNASETLRSKHEFECKALSGRVKVHAFRADNGIY